MNALRQLEECGQAPWLDYMKRSLVAKGELRTLIERDGLKGVTSNPSIFEKAIGESDEYTDELKRFQADSDHSISAIYEHLAIADIRAAADELRPVYDRTQARDGYVSLECSPYLANDTQATLIEARRLWQAVDRRNLMVKVPGTPAGIPAIRALIGSGLNINVTLLFSIAAYEQVVEAYISGLEDLAKAGGDVSRIGSVASFFVSRIDTAADKRLDKVGDQAAAGRLRGKVAIANAKIAYTRYQALFAGPRWEKLAAAGAKTQRLLWASTSTKSPAYKDTMYVEALIGRDTVDTIPPATMDAFREHGEVKPDAIEQDLDGARATLAELKRMGISLDQITQELVEEGVQQFADAFDKLLGAVARRRRTLFEGEAAGLAIAAGSPEMARACADEAEAWRKEGRIRRLWAADKTLWTSTDEDKWLGWLTVVEQELSDTDHLRGFAASVKQVGFTDVVLLGMGGSSLGPEVLGLTFALQVAEGWPRFHMLDSTDPAQIAAIEKAVNIAKTLFIVSSKSGSTLEPNIFMAYFFDRVRASVGEDAAGSHFAAITDPGSALERTAKELKFAHLFYGVRSIGGRYSVLSNFGMAPAAAIGLDYKRLLETTQQMVRACGPDVPPQENPCVQLGIAMGVAATKFQRDKVTIIASRGIADLGAWLEQLLAESTGKRGRGLIPVAAEPLGAPDRYGRDRFFAYLELEGQTEQRNAVDALERAGNPVARMHLADTWHVGAEFFRWEMAVAVAGAIIGINPFDQPDVEASKEKARELTDAYEKSHSLPKEEPVFSGGGVALYADPRNASELGRHDSLSGYLKSHLGRVGAGDYVALLAYIQRDEAHTNALTAMRTKIRDKTRAATCVGFGPRFQHSTGQAYKGGPNSGVFLQITCDDPADFDVPGHSYSFGIVKAAQARGDLAVLVERGRRALRVHLKDVDAGLAELARALDAALG